jgi:hypothetical protein
MRLASDAGSDSPNRLAASARSASKITSPNDYSIASIVRPAGMTCLALVALARRAKCRPITLFPESIQAVASCLRGVSSKT